MLGVFESGVHQMRHDALARRRIHSGDIINWELLASQGLAQAFFESINKDPFSGPQWVNLFQTNENLYRELVREFFASFEFDVSLCRYDPNHLGVRFRLRGEQKEISLLELGWRIGLYSERQSRESATLSGLRKGVTVKANHLLLGFWPTIRDDGFNVGNTKVASIRYPRVKLAPCCIATTITGRKERTHRVTKIDIFYLYCIYSDEVICNILYWLAKYMVGMREKSLICGGMFVTRISRSYRLLTNKMMGALNPAAREVVEEDDKGDEAAGRGAGHEGAGGSVDMYRNMSQGDCQVCQARWMDQQDEKCGRINTWMGQQDERAHWMYDHNVRQFQYLSTRDNLDPTSRLPRFQGMRPITHPLAIRDTCLQAMSTAPAPLKMTLSYRFDEKKAEDLRTVIH
ncbi:hypothetical protein Tco_1243553 [Tanacetum coccineum]